MSSSEAKSLLPFRSKDSASKSSQSSSSDPKTPQLSRTLRQKKQDHDRTVHSKSVRRKIAIPSEAESTSEELVKLPENYEILGEFFKSLETSISVLQLKRLSTTFTNISRPVERLTHRRFTHGHLAQLKYILPEALVLKKVLMFDKRTSCMEPDIHITINPDALESEIAVRKLLMTRLRDHYTSHPEGDEIPEGILPEPFNYPTEEQLSKTLNIPYSDCAKLISYRDCNGYLCEPHHPAAQPTCLQDNANGDNSESAKGEENLSVPVNISIEDHHQQLARATHLPPSFRRHSFQKSMWNKVDDAHQKLPSDSFHPQAVVAVSDLSSKVNSTYSASVDTISHSNMIPTVCASPARPNLSCALVATPIKETYYEEKEDDSLRNIAAMSTPAKLVSTPSPLPPLKRCYNSPDDSSSSSPNKLVRRPSRFKSLKFDTPVKNQETNNEADDSGGLSIDDDSSDILPEDLLQSIREKERIAMEERNPAISQAKRRREMIAKLPKLFNMIQLLIHSIDRFVIARSELVSKIIWGDLSIVDKREVEEQLNLLLELVPDWICEKLEYRDHLLICINKLSDPDSVRSQLEEAK